MAVNEEKYRRMELRKESGTRVITPPEPPAYNRGPVYLVAHACFSCCKSFKQPDKTEGEINVCPECGGIVHRMGRNFTAPKKSDLKQWKKVQILYAEGYRFFGSGMHDGPKLPEKLSDVEMFLRDNPDHPLKVAAPNQALKAEAQKARSI